MRRYFPQQCKLLHDRLAWQLALLYFKYLYNFVVCWKTRVGTVQSLRNTGHDFAVTNTTLSSFFDWFYNTYSWAPLLINKDWALLSKPREEKQASITTNSPHPHARTLPLTATHPSLIAQIPTKYTSKPASMRWLTRCESKGTQAEKSGRVFLKRWRVFRREDRSLRPGGVPPNHPSTCPLQHGLVCIAMTNKPVVLGEVRPPPMP